MGLFKRKFKVASKDANLPKNRKELLKTIIKDDFGLIVDVSLVSFLFSIPLLAVSGISLFILSAGEFKAYEDITPLIFITSLVSIICFMILYMGKIALYGVIKKRAFNEAGLFNETFKDVFKDNFKKGLFIGFIVGLSYFIGINGTIYFAITKLHFLIKGLGIGLSILLFFLFKISGEYFCCLNNYYDLKIKDGLRNSIYLTIMDLFVSILLFIITTILPLILIYLSNISFIILATFTYIYLEGLVISIFTLRSHFLFDISINKTNYPEMVNYGLYKSKEDLL